MVSSGQDLLACTSVGLCKEPITFKSGWWWSCVKLNWYYTKTPEKGKRGEYGDVTEMAIGNKKVTTNSDKSNRKQKRKIIINWIWRSGSSQTIVVRNNMASPREISENLSKTLTDLTRLRKHQIRNYVLLIQVRALLYCDLTWFHWYLSFLTPDVGQCSDNMTPHNDRVRKISHFTCILNISLKVCLLSTISSSPNVLG